MTFSSPAHYCSIQAATKGRRLLATTTASTTTLLWAVGEQVCSNPWQHQYPAFRWIRNAFLPVHAAEAIHVGQRGTSGLWLPFFSPVPGAKVLGLQHPILCRALGLCKVIGLISTQPQALGPVGHTGPILISTPLYPRPLWTD